MGKAGRIRDSFCSVASQTPSLGKGQKEAYPERLNALKTRFERKAGETETLRRGQTEKTNLRSSSLGGMVIVKRLPCRNFGLRYLRALLGEGQQSKTEICQLFIASPQQSRLPRVRGHGWCGCQTYDPSLHPSRRCEP